MRYALNDFARSSGLLAVLAVLLLASCAKEPLSAPAPVQEQLITDKHTQHAIRDAAAKMPDLGIYNHTMDKIIVFEMMDNGLAKDFSFVDPGPGFNFATSNGGQGVYYVESDELVILSEPDQTYGGGGTVVVGNTSLDIDFAFCFSADVDNILGGDLYGADDFVDMAGVIGFAGDFEALQSGDFDEEDPFAYFHGLAYYFVYTDELANTTYEVIEFFEADGSADDLDDLAFAWVIHFQDNGGVYISNDGSLTVSGASMNFNGSYFGLQGLLFFDDPEDEFQFVQVPGFGQMGCD